MKLADLFIKLGLKKDGFDKGLDDAKKKTNIFGSAVKKIGGIMAGAFAVERIFSFGKELFNIARQLEGIERAFSRIGDASTLQGLRDSVKGTVSDLELMKRAVSANNLGVPVESLGTLFEFATQRAQDTGESVDYLVNSIATGLGRKSLLILDNLGLTTTQLTEELNGAAVASASVGELTEAVGRIAKRSLEETGGIADTLGSKVESLGAKWDDLKAKISTLFANSESLKTDLDNWSKLITVWQSEQLNGWQKFWASVSRKGMNKYYEDEQKQQKESIKEVESHKNAIHSIGEVEVVWIRQVSLYEAAKQALKDARKELENFKSKSGRFAGEESAQAYIDKLKELEEAIKNAENQMASLGRSGGGMSQMSTKTDGLSGMFSIEIDTSVLENMDNFRKQLIERISKLSQDTRTRFDEFVDVTETVRSGVTDILTEISESFGEALVGGDWDNFGADVLKAIGGFLKQMGGLLIAYGVFMGLFDKAIKMGPIGWGLALAAGIGMVAAGAAISSLASGGVSGKSKAYSGASASTSASAASAISGDVKFVLEGDKLVGAIDGRNRKRAITR